jgi:hypothetical protein
MCGPPSSPIKRSPFSSTSFPASTRKMLSANRGVSRRLCSPRVAGGGCLFEASFVRGDEVHERRCRLGDDAVSIFAVNLIDGFHAERPKDLHAPATA